MNELIKVIGKAEMAAELAAKEYIDQYGEGMFNCGFAWIEARVRGNTKVGKVLKEHGFKKPYVGTGLHCWNPSNVNTQDMSAKKAGAEAYAAIMERDAGIKCHVAYRLD
jgi:hypothetical protein